MVRAAAAVLADEAAHGLRLDERRRAARRARSGARPPRRATRAASRRRGWRSRAWAGRRPRAGAAAHGHRGAGACPGAGGFARAPGCARRSASGRRPGTARAARGWPPSTSCRCRSGCRRAGTCGCRGRAPARADRGRRRPEHAPGRGQPLVLRRRSAGRPAAPSLTGASVISTSRSSRSASPCRPAGGRRAGRGRRGEGAGQRGRGWGERGRQRAAAAQQGRGLVAPVAAVRLVGALAGEHDLDALGREAGELGERGRGGDAEGLLEARHGGRQLAEEVGLDHGRVVVVGADQAGALGGGLALVERRRGRGSRS